MNGCSRLHRCYRHSRCLSRKSRVRFKSSFAKKKPPERQRKLQITVIAAPVDVDAAAVGAGELGQREASGVGCVGVKSGDVKAKPSQGGGAL